MLVVAVVIWKLDWGWKLPRWLTHAPGKMVLAVGKKPQFFPGGICAEWARSQQGGNCCWFYDLALEVMHCHFCKTVFYWLPRLFNVVGTVQGQEYQWLASLEAILEAGHHRIPECILDSMGRRCIWFHTKSWTWKEGGQEACLSLCLLFSLCPSLSLFAFLSLPLWFFWYLVYASFHFALWTLYLWTSICEPPFAVLARPQQTWLLHNGSHISWVFISIEVKSIEWLGSVSPNSRFSRDRICCLSWFD